MSLYTWKAWLQCRMHGPLIGLVALLGASWTGMALAQDTAPSLYERRLGVIKGTAQGVELIPARKPPAPRPDAESPSRETKPPVAGPEASAASSGKRNDGMRLTLPLRLEPPSGVALKDARRSEASAGVALPTQGDTRAERPRRFADRPAAR